MILWQKSEYPGVAQLVGRDIWDVEVGCSSHLTRTKIPLKLLISEGFSYSLSIAAQEMKLNIFNILLCSSCKCSIIYYNAATLGSLCIMDLENRSGD